MRPIAAILVASLATTALAGEREVIRDLEDNSFLIEEAYNQERGVVQNITTFARDRETGDWLVTYTQEWPVFSEAHQVGFTAPYASQSGTARAVRGLGDIALNYRYQALSDDQGAALAPRLSVLVPTATERSLGARGIGVQLNLPLSVKLGRFLVAHSNVGGTWTPSGRTTEGAPMSSSSYFLGQSLIALVHSRFNVLVELLWTQTWTVTDQATTHADSLVISPGLRLGIDLPGGLQIVPGIGLPIGLGPSSGSLALFGYLSFEFPFSRVATEHGK
jgi:hypothetical protein